MQNQIRMVFNNNAISSFFVNGVVFLKECRQKYSNSHDNRFFLFILNFVVNSIKNYPTLNNLKIWKTCYLLLSWFFLSDNLVRLLSASIKVSRLTSAGRTAMEEELAPFHPHVEILRRLGCSVIPSAQLDTRGLALTVIKNVCLAGQTKDFSADWRNMVEELDILWNPKTDWVIPEWNADVKQTMELDNARKTVWFITRNAKTISTMLVAAFVDQILLTAMLLVTTEASIFPVPRRLSLALLRAWAAMLALNTTLVFATRLARKASMVLVLFAGQTRQQIG